ncbi:MAG: tyrosine-type recombinase/integrase [Bradyrhizobium sp.]
MARPEKLLTGRRVETTKAPGLHADGGGLYLHVTKTGAKSWIFRWRCDGRLRDMGLGPLRVVSLAEARDRALGCRKLVYGGGDPIDERRAQRQAARLDATRIITFAECAKAYIASHQAGWRNPKHAAQWPSTLAAYAYPVLGELPVQAIDTALAMKAIDPIWMTKPETASRVRGRIEAVLDWATARGYRQGENPARWKGHLENLLPKKTKVRPVEHHAALPYAELPVFMAELRQQQGVAARSLEFAILTAARTGEVIGTRWAEIDFAVRLWTVPPERMKAGREHRVPLSDAAAAIVENMSALRIGEYVFPGQRADRPLSSMAMLMLLRRMGHGDLTTHGFRSTFSDWVAERTAVPAEVREMALAHTVGDKVEAAYRRGDLFAKRRQLAEAWARYCGTPAGDDARVVAIGQARR